MSCTWGWGERWGIQGPACWLLRPCLPFHHPPQSLRFPRTLKDTQVTRWPRNPRVSVLSPGSRERRGGNLSEHGYTVLRTTSELQNEQVALKPQAKRPRVPVGGVGLASRGLLTTEHPPLQPAAQMMQNMEKIQAEQKRMKTQGERSGWRVGSQSHVDRKACRCHL